MLLSLQRKVEKSKFYVSTSLNMTNKIKRNPHGVEIYYGDKSEFFTYDKVILATHADEALALIENPLDQEKDTLSKFGYKKNVAIIHTDEIAMPKNRKIWSSWNSSIDKIDTQ